MREVNMSKHSTGNGKRRSKPHNRNFRDWPVEWLRIARPPEAAKLSSISWDTIEREHKDKIVRPSKRTVGLRVGDCLMIAAND
jgi:hypothetical protein